MKYMLDMVLSVIDTLDPDPKYHIDNTAHKENNAPMMLWINLHCLRRIKWITAKADSCGQYGGHWQLYFNNLEYIKMFIKEVEEEGLRRGLILTYFVCEAEGDDDILNYHTEPIKQLP